MSGRRILLLGHPVEHSLSPAFQQAAFDSIGLPVRYEAMDVAPADLARVVAELRADPLVMGANVTVPHKEKIAPLLDSLTDDAVQIGAVNTITRAGSRLVGRNTDAAGFRGALNGLLDGRRTPRHALVLGAGGAAKAAISALVTAGVAQISIANRHLARAERETERFVAIAGAVELASLVVGRGVVEQPAGVMNGYFAAGFGQRAFANLMVKHGGSPNSGRRLCTSAA
jgi:shikimate dehydrogenase